MSSRIAMALLTVLMQASAGQEPPTKDLAMKRLDTLIELAEAKRESFRIRSALDKLAEGKLDPANDKTLDRLTAELNAAEKALKALQSRPQSSSAETQRAIRSTAERIESISRKAKLAQTDLTSYFRSELADAGSTELKLTERLKSIQKQLDRPPEVPPPPGIVFQTSLTPLPFPTMIFLPSAPATPTTPVTPVRREGPQINSKDHMQYAWIPPGKFKMGCAPNDRRCAKDEDQPHDVSFPQGFWITNTEVTADAYVNRYGHLPQRTDTNPKWKFGELPVVKVKWKEAQQYCIWAGGRLPNEAEWEYAARGTAKEPHIYPWGDTFDPEKCNSAGRKQQRNLYPEATPVFEFPANVFGLFGMTGNVREWVLDIYRPEGSAQNAPSGNSAASESTMDHVIRGGSWNDGEKDLRISARYHMAPGKADNQTGFRCVIPEGQFPVK